VCKKNCFLTYRRGKEKGRGIQLSQKRRVRGLKFYVLLIVKKINNHRYLILAVT